MRRLLLLVVVVVVGWDRGGRVGEAVHLRVGRRVAALLQDGGVGRRRRVHVLVGAEDGHRVERVGGLGHERRRLRRVHASASASAVAVAAELAHALHVHGRRRVVHRLHCALHSICDRFFYDLPLLCFFF